MRSLPEIISDMRDIVKLLNVHQGTLPPPEMLNTLLEMLAIDVQHLAKHVLIQEPKRALGTPLDPLGDGSFKGPDGA
jgi:hypothetical protein